MKYLFLDIETTGTDWKRDCIHGVGYGWEEDDVFYSTIEELPDDVIKALVDPSVAKVGHNLRFDLRFLYAADLDVAGPILDTMLMAQLINENQSVGLKPLTQKYLGLEYLSDKQELDRTLAAAGCKHVGELCRLDLADSQYPNGQAPYYDVIAQYCIEDVNNTIRLFCIFKDTIKILAEKWKTERGLATTVLDYLKGEAFPVEQVLFKMELRGIALNPKAIEEAQKSTQAKHLQSGEDIQLLCAREVLQIEEELYENALSIRKTDKGKAKVEKGSARYGTRFNIASSNHVGKLIYEGLQAPKVFKTRGGAYSTSEMDLTALKGEVEENSKLLQFLELFSKFRELEKLQTTYVGTDSSLLKDAVDGRVYSYYIQAGSSKDGGKGGTATGRLSSQAPNMQNLPRGSMVKSFFIPDPDHVFAYFDYSQVELRIAAHLSQDQELLDAYSRGDDLHTLTARSVFGRHSISKEERQVGKTLNFALIYDAKAYRLWQMLGSLGYSIEDCEAMRRAFFKKYFGYKSYLQDQTSYMVANRCVVAETGRVRRLPDIDYGACLDWTSRTFKGPAAMVDALKQHPSERMTSNDVFQRAKKKFNHAQKQGFNFPIQSLGASIAKRAMISLDKRGFEVVTQCHDSIVVQLSLADTDSIADIRAIMENTYKISVPLIAEGKLIRSLDESDLYKPALPAEGE